MKQYIDKDALVAEIRSRLLPVVIPQGTDYDDWDRGADSERLNILSFINTLEVKEVGLDNNMTDIKFEEEIDNFMYGTRNPERFPDSFQVRDEHTGLTVLDWKCYVNNPKRRIEFAKYFFELGLKAQKGE